ncbi:MAG TPA: hypothetical protein VL856_17095 [Acidimicrobiia bacterium]|nr:hypothetical protein [Acidimicrobiia bacterium]
MSDTTADWDALLDRLENRLDDAARLLVGEPTDALPPFEIPEMGSEMPTDRVARAQALVARGNEIEAQLRARTQEIRTELRRMPRVQATRSGATRFQADA